MEIKAISYTLLLLLSIALTATAQPINWDSVRADYAQKYKVQQMPSWLFPLIFEEGGGQRDTLYLGYDPKATDNLLGPDTIFGEKLTYVDTNKFNANVCWIWYCGSGVLCDTVSKINISQLSNYNQCGGGSFEFQLINGTLPLTVYWDKAAFHSDSLPFADQSPAPRAEGRLRFDLPMRAYADSNKNLLCPFDDYILLSDTAKPNGPGGCWKQDTVMFFHSNHNQNAPIGQLQLKIVPWQGIHLSIREKEEFQDVHLYPNPVDEKLWINNQSNHKLRYGLYNINGQRLKSGTVNGLQKRSIPCYSLSPGMYFIQLKRNGRINGAPIIVH